MSEENVEIVRRFHDAYAQGDFRTSMSCFDPDVEFSPPSFQPGASIYHGHEGVRKWSRDLDEEVEELHDLGGGRYLGAGRFQGRRKGSGAEFDVPMA